MYTVMPVYALRYIAFLNATNSHSFTPAAALLARTPGDTCLLAILRWQHREIIAQQFIQFMSLWVSATAATTATTIGRTRVGREGLPKNWAQSGWLWVAKNSGESRKKKKNQNNHKFGMSNDNFSPSSAFPVSVSVSFSLCPRVSAAFGGVSFAAFLSLWFVWFAPFLFFYTIVIKNSFFSLFINI